MSSGSLHGLSGVAETNYGVTPATPVFKRFRHKGFSEGLSRDSLQSEELRYDRMIQDFRLGAKKVNFEIPVELSYGAFDEYLEAGAGGTWTANVLKSGILRRSFTMERKFGDLQSADKPYHRFTGCEVNSLSLQVNANQMVTGSIGFIGQDLVLDTAIVTGATYTAAPTNSPFDSFTGTVREDGTLIAIVTEIQLALNNGLEPLFVVGSNVTTQPDIKRSNCTGSLGLRFTGSSMMEKFMNETRSSLEFELTDKQGNKINFKVPNLQYTGGSPNVNGEGTIPIQMPFQAILDETSASNLVITRTPAA